MIKITLLIAVSLLLFSRADALPEDGLTDRGTRFREANERYAGGDYCGASNIYAELIEEGVVHSSLYYNMGNACFRCGELGRAIVYYEKARKISPRDRDINHNLDFVRSRVTEQEANGSFLGIILSKILYLFSLEEIFALEQITAVLLALFGILYINTRRGSRRRPLRICLLCTGILLCCSLLLIASKTMDERNTKAIVLIERVDALSGPGVDNVKVLSIPEGMKVWVDEDRGDWYLIHLSTGRGGWVKKETIGLI